MALTQDRLKSVVEYNPETGVFTWISDHGKRCQKGNIAGFKGGPGYRQIRIDGTAYFEHRLAVLFMTGHWPTDVVDHIDRDKKNNRWDNLRLATWSQNSANARAKRLPNRTSSFKGVNLDTRRGKWVSFIKVNGKSMYLGSFDDETQASLAYQTAAKCHFGEFGRS